MGMNNEQRSLHKIDLSFTRISQNGLFILDELFNKLVVKTSTSPNASSRNKNNGKKETSERRTQSFEILLKGCFFKPMLCKNFNAKASVPKLQTFCTELR